MSDGWLRYALEQISEHFDDQGFPDVEDHEEIIVNYAGAVLGGYAGSLAEYAEEHYGR